MKTLNIVFALMLYFVLITCTQKSDHTITIGAILPLTGDIASYGKSAQRGIQLAVEDINKNLKQNDYKIYIDYGDSKSVSSEAVNWMIKFASLDKYPVIIGESGSSLSLAITPIANENKVVLISPISSSPELTLKGGQYFYRVCPSDAYQAVVLSDWATSMGFKNISVIYINTSWGQSIATEFKKSFELNGGKIAYIEGINEGQTEFRTLLSKVVKSKPDAVFGATHGREGGLLLRQFQESKYHAEVFGADVWGSPELVETAGDASEGVVVCRPAEFSGMKYSEFALKFKQKYNLDAEIYAAFSYDIVAILNQAFQSGARTSKQIKEYLDNMPLYNGVTGPTQFDKNGDTNTKPFDLFIYRSKKLVPLNQE